MNTDNYDGNIEPDNEIETPIYNQVANQRGIPDNFNWISTVRKAFVGAAVGAAPALGTSVTATTSDGVFTVADFWLVFTFTVSAAVVGFAAVWAVPNKD